MKIDDLTGKRFGKWIVLGEAPSRWSSAGNKRHYWKCRCDCGTIREVVRTSLVSGRSTSCGCVHSEIARTVLAQTATTHGWSKTRLYKIWSGMKKRCNNPKSNNYCDYGGRGISVCREWNNFEPFRDWAIANGYNDNLSIDRIDNDGNYEPNNCRWASAKQQSNNRRSNKKLTYNGVTKTISEWADYYCIDKDKLYSAFLGVDLINTLFPNLISYTS